MNYRPDEDAHFVAKRRQYIKRKKKTKTIVISLLCIAIAIVWVMIICTVKKFKDARTPAETAAETIAEVTAAETAAETADGSFYANAETVELEIPATAVGSGSLVLVSDHLGCGIPEKAPAMTTVWGNKSATYYVASSSIQLESETFRAADKMFSDYYAENSNGDYQITMGYYPSDAIVCCGEHGTGYAFDVNVYRKDGTSMRLSEAVAYDGMYSWLYDNAAKYGFVLRYGADKTGVTGMEYDPDHFRYVGVPHAQYMVENNLSLEEYIGELQKYPYEGEHLKFSADGTDYEVFYVKLPEDAEAVAIDLPSDVSYTVSGDNICGAVVTLFRAK